MYKEGRRAAVVPWRRTVRFDSGTHFLYGFGWIGAMGTYVSIDPSEKASVVYMHNLDPNMEEYTHIRVRNMAYGALR